MMLRLRYLIVLALAPLAGCEAAEGSAAPYSIMSCRDPVTNTMFTFDTRKVYDRVTVLGGESYGSYRGPENREMKVTETWLLLNCKFIERHE